MSVPADRSTSTFQPGAHRACLPGTTLEQTEAVADQVAAIIDKDPETSTACSSASSSATAFINIVLKKDRERTSTEFERALTPQLAPDPRRAGQLPEPERRRRQRGRDITSCFLGSDNPELLIATANKIVDEMSGAEGTPRAARPGRPGPARNH